VQRVVVVRLGGVVHDGVRIGEQDVDELGIDDVALDEPHAVLGEPVERGAVARVGQLVEDGDMGIGVADDVVHEVGTDEAGAAGDEQSLHALQRTGRADAASWRLFR